MERTLDKNKNKYEYRCRIRKLRRQRQIHRCIERVVNALLIPATIMVLAVLWNQL